MSYPIVSEAQAAEVVLTPTVYDPERDPRVDHDDELYPKATHVESWDGVLIRRHGVEAEQIVGDNVDDDGVAHFLLITQDPAEPDLCGGCRKEWPCGQGVPLLVVERPRVDPGLLEAVLAAVREERESGRLA
jgi:hypothetical protein